MLHFVGGGGRRIVQAGGLVSASHASSFRRLFCANVSASATTVPSSSSASTSTDAPSSSAYKSISGRERRQVLNKEYAALPPLNIYDAIPKVREAMWAKFDETIELSVVTSLDPRKPNQSVKGVVALPHGNGKSVRVAVFAQGADAQAAIDAGADIVGSDDLIKRIQGGEIDFQRAIATPEVMGMVSKIGKLLGPKGLMPNPKLGTLTTDVAKAIKSAKAGSIQFKVEKKGIIMAGIAKASFSDEQILDNIKAFMVAIVDCKPEGFKGKYLSRVHISSTMGPGVELELPSIDPSNSRFMIDPRKL